jgi:toxin ParE1/3/4
LTHRVTVRSEAERDLEEAQDWYDRQRDGLGEEFRGTVDDLVARLVVAPQLYPIVHRGVRRAVLRRFPYLVYFAVSGDSVVILACLHAARNPKVARSRTR